MRTRIIALAAALAAASPTLGKTRPHEPQIAPPPVYDTAALCTRMSHGSQSGFNVCAANEERALFRVRRLWPHYDADLRDRCDTANAYRSYQGLLSCLYDIRPLQDARGRPVPNIEDQ